MKIDIYIYMMEIIEHECIYVDSEHSSLFSFCFSKTEAVWNQRDSPMYEICIL